LPLSLSAWRLGLPTRLARGCMARVVLHSRRSWPAWSTQVDGQVSRELIAAYSPWEPIARVLESAGPATNDTPERVIPNVARALSEALSGRTAVLLRMVFDMARGDPDTAEGVQRAMSRGLPDLIAYLDRQMAAGRLRRTHPVLALQLLAGPIVAHELTRPLAAMIGFTPPRDQLAEEVACSWLRAMAPGHDESA
jgi:hypothetical protein